MSSLTKDISKCFLYSFYTMKRMLPAKYIRQIEGHVHTYPSFQILNVLQSNKIWFAHSSFVIISTQYLLVYRWLLLRQKERRIIIPTVQSILTWPTMRLRLVPRSLSTFYCWLNVVTFSMPSQAWLLWQRFSTRKWNCSFLGICTTTWWVVSKPCWSPSSPEGGGGYLNKVLAYTVRAIPTMYI